MIRSDIYYLTINSDVTVEHQLTCSCTSRSDTKTVNNVVETRLE